MPNPFALPVHPAIVHFPVAMLTATWVCLIVRYVTGDERWDERSRLFELVGVAALPITILAAFIDTRGFGFILRPRFDAPLIWHMTAGLTAAAVFSGHYLWRRRYKPAELAGRLAVVDVVSASLGMCALFGAGLIAAEIVYGT